MKKIVSALSLFAMIPAIVSAHPGHGGTDGYTIIHYFTEPVHAVALGVVMIAAFFYVRYAMKKNQHSKN